MGHDDLPYVSAYWRVNSHILSAPIITQNPKASKLQNISPHVSHIPHEAYLFDATGLALEDIRDGQRGKILAEKKVRDVETAISQMLGYGPEQFRQIVLLPQGRFETFLSAKTKERLEILRDLFDVSIYRSLASKLKADAEAAERQVRQEREVCVRRLAAERFESTDALAEGIADARVRRAGLLAAEKEARLVRDAAQTALTMAGKCHSPLDWHAVS